MPGMPTVRPVKLTVLGRNIATAQQAVRSGIATHAQKHKAAMQERYKLIESERKLKENTEKTH